MSAVVEDWMEMALTSESNRTVLLSAASESVGWDEQELVRAAKGGSQKAFEQLVERYEGSVFRLARAAARLISELCR